MQGYKYKPIKVYMLTQYTKSGECTDDWAWEWILGNKVANTQILGLGLPSATADMCARACTLRV